MELKAIIAIIVFAVIIGVIVYRNWDAIARRPKGKTAEKKG